MTIFLSSLAVLLAGIAVQRNVYQDRETARDKANEAVEEAIRAQQEVERVAVEACLQENIARENQYRDNMALILIVLQNRAGSEEPIPQSIHQYIEFTKAAYEPLNCEYGESDFAVDVTPPPNLPYNPLIGDNPYESSSR